MAQHRIETMPTHPIVQRDLQIPKIWGKEIDDEINKLLICGISAHSKSPWASRIIPLRKKSGEIRMCIDYRALNKITTKDNYPLRELMNY